ncbi:GNAT family N-acetyltransferase [Streptomyces sp. NPDC018019]|uniref:GNAT family N-acetyltransferase n=1 Tax=Streptomyces sp. NPDC018019 TaxID=3365030 RepID=UPI0037A59BCA
MDLPIDNPPIDTAGSHPFPTHASPASPSAPFPLPAAHPDLVRAWVHGLARCRGAAAPVAVHGGFYVEVRVPVRSHRYVFPAADPDVLRGLIASITTPNLWVNVCAPRSDIAPALPPTWEFAEPQFLMSATLPPAPAPVAAPTGYTVETVDEDGTGVLQCRVLDAATGELAARGRAGLTDAATHPSAVFDMINTSAGHRRRGLGRLVMNTLSAHAVRLGATHGVLVASPAGRSLYRSLGWRLHAPVTAVRIPPPTEDGTG